MDQLPPLVTTQDPDWIKFKNNDPEWLPAVNANRDRGDCYYATVNPVPITQCLTDLISLQPQAFRTDPGWRIELATIIIASSRVNPISSLSLLVSAFASSTVAYSLKVFSYPASFSITLTTK
jgi:hypothetical protein